MILLDTHVLLWFRTAERQIGPHCRQQVAEALQEGILAVSAFSFWEIAMLLDKGRISLPSEIAPWRADLLENYLTEIPVDGQIGIRANNLPNFHADPADRIIVATALEGHRLLTADDLILRWAGSMDRLDARE